MEGVAMTRACVRILAPFVGSLRVNREALRRGFSPGVFATDRALELVAEGMPFRDAYHFVKAHLDELGPTDAASAVARKRHLGAPAGLDFASLRRRAIAGRRFARREWHAHCRALSRLMGMRYPLT
jgi:argininosuccinate lyase